MSRVPEAVSVTNDDLLWIDIANPNKENLKELGNRFSFHELALEDCLSRIQIPKINRYSDHIFMILHFPIMQEGSVPRVGQLSMFVGNGYIVTVHKDEMDSIKNMLESCSNGSIVKRQKLMGKSSGYLFHSIIDALVDKFLEDILSTRSRIEAIEDQVFDKRTSVADEIAIMRRQVMALRRIALSLKPVLAEFGVKDIKNFAVGEDLVPYFDDVKEHLEKVVRTLEEMKDTIEIFNDTDFMHSMGRTNRILAVLTIVFTLSLPAAIASSFYGMNVQLPGGIDAGDWTFLGTYTTLFIVGGISASIASSMFWHFRRLKWI